MRDPITVLKSLTEKSTDKGYKFQRLYRNLYNPEFYHMALRNIYANDGAMTPGTDNTTLDGYSEKRIAGIIESLKNHSYQPKPARREYIPKKSNPRKKRPLGIPSGDDKLIQEIVRMMLESIYETTFSGDSHGFRPKRSCHTALKQIQNTFTGTHWFIEGDIEACFDSFDHHVIIDLLRQRIDDEAFLALIWKFLRAGYMEQWEFQRTYCGTPQGSGISPILANIYLNELDKFMDEWKRAFSVGSAKGRKLSHEYLAARHRMYQYRDAGKEIWTELSRDEREERAKNLRALRRTLCTTAIREPKESSYKSIQYVRYADDFIVGVIGSKADAEMLKEAIKEFLADKLKLKLSDAKTQITHTGDRARFLGYDITVSRDQTTKKLKNGSRQRVYSYVVKLLVPREKWIGKLLEYDAMKIVVTEKGKERFKAMHRSKLINQTDIAILSAYNAEIRGLYNYYSLANDAYKIGRFANIMKYSMYKTFANKYRTNVKRIKARYLKNGWFTVSYETKNGKREAIYYKGGFKRKKEPSVFEDVATLPAYKKYDRKNSLRTRMKSGHCELCGRKTNSIELHQVKRLKGLTGKEPWETEMLKRRRKTLMVCPDCHGMIHAEDYLRRQ